jgi:endonuclease IV
LASEIGLDVIIHQGKNVPEEKLSRLEAINNYVRHVSEALERTESQGNMIILENSARQGNELGHALDELAYIYGQFEDHLKPRIGFCLDLCHAFVAGELDVRRREHVSQYFEMFRQKLGLDKLKCVHYNDSDVSYSGCNDHHGDLGCGYITNTHIGGSTEGMRCVAELCYKHRIPVIFETPCSMRSIHPQAHWQTAIVQAWATGDDSVYQEYLQTYAVDQIYAESVRKKPAKKTKLLPNTAGSGSGSGSGAGAAAGACPCSSSEPVSAPAAPKVKLVLRKVGIETPKKRLLLLKKTQETPSEAQVGAKQGTQKESPKSEE